VHPLYIDTLCNYGALLERVRHDIDGAQALYDKALGFDQNHRSVLYNYGVLLEDARKDYPAAQAMYRRALQEVPVLASFPRPCPCPCGKAILGSAKNCVRSQDCRFCVRSQKNRFAFGPKNPCFAPLPPPGRRRLLTPHVRAMGCMMERPDLTRLALPYRTRTTLRFLSTWACFFSITSPTSWEQRNALRGVAVSDCMRAAQLVSHHHALA